MKSEVSPVSGDGENKVNDTHTAMTNSFGKALSNDSLHDEYKFGSSPSPTLRERTRSLNAPSPIQQFGPCGRIMKNSAMVMTIQDPASQRLTWYKPPLTVLVIKKVRDAMVIPPFIALCKCFIIRRPPGFSLLPAIMVA